MRLGGGAGYGARSAVEGGSSPPCADKTTLSSQESRHSVSVTRGQAAQI